jgi:hypothetical protein
MEEQLAFTISASDLGLFTKKLVKGLTYIELREYLGPEYKIHLMPLTVGADAFADSLRLRRQPFDYSPAIRARFVRAHEDPHCAIYEFEIWEQIMLHVVVGLASHMEALGIA